MFSKNRAAFRHDATLRQLGKCVQILELLCIPQHIPVHLQKCYHNVIYLILFDHLHLNHDIKSISKVQLQRPLNASCSGAFFVPFDSLGSFGKIMRVQFQHFQLPSLSISIHSVCQRALTFCFFGRVMNQLIGALPPTSGLEYAEAYTSGFVDGLRENPSSLSLKLTLI